MNKSNKCTLTAIPEEGLVLAKAALVQPLVHLAVRVQTLPHADRQFGQRHGEHGAERDGHEDFHETRPHFAWSMARGYFGTTQKLDIHA